MREPMQALIGALERDEGGIAVVWCPDLGLRDWLVGEVESVARPDARPFRTSSVEVAIAEPERMALLIPNNEREVVLDLEGSRDRLLNVDDGARPRTQPIVLFLLRDGDGQKCLATEAFSLESWIKGSDADPELLAEIDVPHEREAFVKSHGQSPEAWLRAWRAGELPQNTDNFQTSYRAFLLEEP
jgi:hypothetical protein